MSYESALSLFDGEKDGVLSRMRILIQENLSHKNDSFIKELAEKTGCSFEYLKLLKKGHDPQGEEDKDKFVFNVFQRIEGPLNLSIHHALGSPSLKNGKKEHWQRQRKIENPIFFIGRTGKGTGSDAELSQEDEDSKELDLYVKLRAIEELIEFSKTEP